MDNRELLKTQALEQNKEDVLNTFIIPVAFEHEYAERCVKSIHKYNKGYRIILIDQTPNACMAHLKDMVHVYVSVYRNLGFAKAMNMGIQMATTPYITLCNDDIEFINEKWFPQILELFDKAPNILAINPSSVKDIHGDRSKDWMEYKSEYTEEDYESLMTPKPDHEPPYQPSWVFEGSMMFCTVFRAEALQKTVGLLDEGFYPGSGEDYDWNIRCYSLPKYQPEKGSPQPYKIVGYNGSWVYHHWLTSKNKFDWNGPDLKKYRFWPGFREKWMTETENDPDIYGRKRPGVGINTIVTQL